MSHHKELFDMVENLSRNTLTPTNVWDEPLINPGIFLLSERDTTYGPPLPNNPPRTVVYSKQKGVLMFRYMWEKGTNSVLDIWVVNTDV